jgi:cytidylate kinase
MTLLFVWGPPAVGKMAVGRAIAESSDFRLFHNHATIEPLLDVFDYGTPAFLRLNGEMRHRILEEAAAADVNLVQTYAWALDEPEDAAAVEAYLQIFLDADREVRLVELYADLDTRLARNGTAYRLSEKKSKRDLAWSDDNVRSLEQYQLNTGIPSVGDAVIARHPHLRIDNTDRSPEDVAEEVLAWIEQASTLPS